MTRYEVKIWGPKSTSTHQLRQLEAFGHPATKLYTTTFETDAEHGTADWALAGINAVEAFANEKGWNTPDQDGRTFEYEVARDGIKEVK